MKDILNERKVTSNEWIQFIVLVVSISRKPPPKRIQALPKYCAVQLAPIWLSSHLCGAPPYNCKKHSV
jgi:hypothetical protein